MTHPLVVRCGVAVALGVALLCAGCRDAADTSGEASSPREAAVSLRETAVPGERYTIAEVTTVERIMRSDATLVVHETEIGKHLEVEIVQVEPDGQPVRYRKRFERFRQRNMTQVGELPPVHEALVHPVEAHTLEYVWRGEAQGWAVRQVEGPGEAPSELPASVGTRAHPWLPEHAVQPGDTWSASELPLSLPDVAPGHITTQLRLERIELRDAPRHRGGGLRVAHVDVRVEVAPPDAHALRGHLEGHYQFVLPDMARGIAGRLERIQLAGTLTRPAHDAEPALELRIVVYRATE